MSKSIFFAMFFALIFNLSADVIFPIDKAHAEAASSKNCTFIASGKDTFAIMFRNGSADELKNILLSSAKIFPSWPEAVLSFAIIAENMKKSGRLGIKYNNALIIIRAQEKDDDLYFFEVERLKDVKNVEKVPKNIIMPTGRAADKIKSMGGLVESSDGFVFVAYSSDTDKIDDTYLIGIDAILLQVLPGWQNGARQSIGVTSSSIKNPVIILYNGFGIFISPNSAMNVNGKITFSIAVNDFSSPQNPKK